MPWTSALATISPFPDPVIEAKIPVDEAKDFDPTEPNYSKIGPDLALSNTHTGASAIRYPAFQQVRHSPSVTMTTFEAVRVDTFVTGNDNFSNGEIRFGWRIGKNLESENPFIVDDSTFSWGGALPVTLSGINAFSFPTAVDPVMEIQFQVWMRSFDTDINNQPPRLRDDIILVGQAKSVGSLDFSEIDPVTVDSYIASSTGPITIAAEWPSEFEVFDRRVEYWAFGIDVSTAGAISWWGPQGAFPPVVTASGTPPGAGVPVLKVVTLGIDRTTGEDFTVQPAGTFWSNYISFSFAGGGFPPSTVLKPILLPYIGSPAVPDFAQAYFASDLVVGADSTVPPIHPVHKSGIIKESGIDRILVY